MASPAAEDLPDRPAHRPRRRRWLRRVLLCLPAVLLLLWLLREPLLAPPLLRLAEDRLAATLGGRWHIDGLGGSWFGDIEIRGVRTVLAADRTPLRRVHAGRLAADWSLLNLIRRPPGWLAGLRIEAEDLRLELDLDQGGTSGEEASGELPALPAALPSVRLHGLDIAARAGGRVLRMTGGELRIEGEELTLRAPSLAVATGVEAARAGNLHGRIRRVAGGSLAAGLHVAGPTLDVDLQARGIPAGGRLPATLPADLAADLALRLQREDTPLFAAAGLTAAPSSPPLPSEVRLLASLQGGEVDVKDLILVAPEYRLHATAAGRPATAGEPARFSLRAAAAVSRPGDVIGLPLLQPFQLTTAGEVTFDGAALALDLQDLAVLCEGESLSLERPARLELRENSAVLEDLELSTPCGRITAAARVPRHLPPEYAPDPPIDLRAELTGLDLARLSGLLPTLGPLPVQAGGLELSFVAAGSFRDPVLRASLRATNWRFLRFSGPPLPGPASVDLEARYEGDRLELETAHIVAPGLELAGEAAAGLRLELADLLAGGAQPLLGGLSGSFTGTAEDVAKLVPFLPLRLGVPARASLTATLAGSLREPEVLADLDLWQGRGGTPVLAAELLVPCDLEQGLVAQFAPLRLEAALDGLRLREDLLPGDPGPISGRLQATRDASGLRADVDLGLADLSGLAGLLPVRLPPAARGHLAARVTGTLLRPEVQGRLEFWQAAASPAARADLGLAFDVETGRVAAGTAATLALDLQGLEFRQDQGFRRLGTLSGRIEAVASRGVAEVKSLELHGTGWTVHGTGRGQLPAPWSSITGGEAPDDSPGLAASLDAEVADLAILETLSEVRRAAGSLELHASLEGPLDAIRPRGTLRLRDGALRLATPAIAPLERLNLDAEMSPERVSIAHFAGELGAAPFTAQGVLLLDPGAGAEPRFDLRLQGRDLLLHRQSGVKVRADTDLTLSGPLSGLLASGAVRITDGRYVRDVDLLGLPRGGAPAAAGPRGLQLFSLAPPLDRLRLDLRVSAENGFRIDNNVADGMLRPALHLGGTGAVPLLDGEVYVENLDVSLPANRLRVDRGVIRFLGEDPFLPRLDLLASLRRYGYDVTAAVTGPYDAPEILLSSIPPLSREDLLLLVTAGKPPDADLGAREALGTVAVYLARDLASSVLGDGSTESEESFLERFEAEIGRDATRSGEETVEGRFRLVRDVLVPGDALFLEGEKDAFGDFNLGLRVRFRCR